jgi:hypothetical protein
MDKCKKKKKAKKKRRILDFIEEEVRLRVWALD